MESSAFANTRQHTADRQADGGTIERFTNTKLNIALINDPKNGPRFTMTKREQGVGEKDEAPAAKDEPQTPREIPESAAPPAKPNSQPSPPAIKNVAASNRFERTDAANGASALATPRAPEPPKPEDKATPAALLAKPAPAEMPPPPEAQQKVPIDSSKTFVGHNGNYYDESWRWMDWRGTNRSWNWPAALSFGHWFAYRRLYLFAGLHLVWLAGLAAAAVNDIPILGLALLAILMVGLAGVYGNKLYFRAFRRAVDHVTRNGEGSYEELRGQLADAGGTRTAAPCIMAAVTIASIASALAATYYLRGGFFFNLWPF